MLCTARFANILTRLPVLNAIRCVSTITGIKGLSPSPIPPSIILSNNPWIWRKPEPLQLPINKIKPFILPDNLPKISRVIIEPNNLLDNIIVDDPLIANNNAKQAVNLIVIRRKKMKKHKLKKLRKKMKYYNAKVRQRRELKKEKEFQAVLIKQCKDAEVFSAEEFVANKLKEAAAEPPVPFHESDEYKELMRRKKLRLDLAK